jgi:hypothetical protein
MTHTCTTCGRTESQATAEARAVGLMQEFLDGMYTCCQVAQWANEQLVAWFEAIHADGEPNEKLAELRESQVEAVLVRVRGRGVQVPWFRNPDDLR